MVNISLTDSGGLSTARAQSQLRVTSDGSARDVARLSSGKNLVRAGDDVANMSISTKMNSRIAGLRSASTNLRQAASLIQVMDGALQEIDGLLQRMNSVAVQASSGVLTDAERGFLNQEFQQLSDEIDRLSGNTEFNGVKVLSAESGVVEYTNTVDLDDNAGEEYAAYLHFTQNWNGNNRWIRLGTASATLNATQDGNERIYFRNNVNAGTPALNVQNVDSLSGKVEGLYNLLSDPENLYDIDPVFSEVKYDLVGPTTIKVTGRSRGEISSLFLLGDRWSHADIRASLEVLSADKFHQVGGDDDNFVLRSTGIGSETGLVQGSTSAEGATGGLLAVQNQRAAEVRIQVANETGGVVQNNRIRIDNGVNGLNNIRFRNNATQDWQQIQLGSNNRETLKNAVAFYENLREESLIRAEADATFQLWAANEKLEFERDGLDLIVRSKLPGNPLDFYGNAIRVVENMGGTTITNQFLDNGADSGVNASAVINKDFLGTIQGFEATYLEDDSVQLSIAVGEATYIGIIDDTDLLTGTDRVRMFSDDHGYFDMDLESGKGMAVSNQSDADIYASEMDMAFKDLSFFQERQMTNLYARGDYEGIALRMRSNDFSTPTIIESFDVISVASAGGSARFEMVVNGETYKSDKVLDLGFDPYAEVTLINQNDRNKTITLKNGATDFLLETDGQAEVFAREFSAFLPFGEASISLEPLSFQTDSESTSILEVQTFDASTNFLFDTEDISVVNVAQATVAIDVVQAAIDKVTSMRAEIGAQQSRTDIALSYVTNSLATQDAARAIISDTDIASISTSYALNQVKYNSSVAVIAQGNQLRREVVTGIYDPLAQLATNPNG